MTQHVNIDLTQCDDIVCSGEVSPGVICNSALFNVAYVVKRISALASPTGKEVLYPIQVYTCSACGTINTDMLRGIYGS
jgi:hypothetical protein